MMNYKKMTKTKFWILAPVVCLLFSCQKDYITGGEREDVNKYANVSTYDVLKSMPQFDTLVQLIDAAEMKELVNSENTFFAPSNTSVFGYLQMRTLDLQNTVGLDKRFLLDSLVYYLKNNIHQTRDSLSMYLVNEKLSPDILKEEGTLFATGLKNDKVNISFEETKDGDMGYTDLVSGIPRLVYYTQLWNEEDMDNGNRVLCKTSFIKTKNGYINVLERGHILFFYGR